MSSIQTQVFTSREQSIPLAFDVTPVFAVETFILTAPDFIEGLLEMAHDMEFVEKDAGLRCILAYRVSKCLPHVHRRQLNTGALFFALRHPPRSDVLVPGR